MGSYPHILWVLVLSARLEAKTNEPLFVDPFDQGAGASVLTRATQNGIAAANPALLADGDKLLRWLGSRLTLYPGSLGARENASSPEISDSAPDPASDPSGFLDFFTAEPLHVGGALAASIVTGKLAVLAFANAHADIKATSRQSGDEGQLGVAIPRLAFRKEIYAGSLVATAAKLSPWLAIGATGKYLIADDRLSTIDGSDVQGLERLQESIEELYQFDSGNSITGLDFGSLIFLPAALIDWRLAATVSNVLVSEQSDKVEARSSRYANLGLGVTIHRDKSAIHLSLDYRDLANVFEQGLGKRIYCGARITIGNSFGVAIGMHHGAPSYGIEVDLAVIKLGLSTYTREYGRQVGDDPRKIYALSMAGGSYF